MNNALVKEAENQHKNLLALQVSIEESIVNSSRVIVSIENKFSCCRNCFYIEDFEIQEDSIMIGDGNFEIYYRIEETTKFECEEDKLIFDLKTAEECLHIEFI